MEKISKNQQQILSIFLKNKSLASSEVHEQLSKLDNVISLITVKRELTELKNRSLLHISGAGRSVVYSISSYGRLLSEIDADRYCSIDPDKRHGLSTYNFELFNSIHLTLFSDSELAMLDEAQKIYVSNIKSISQNLEEKELERFVIELSWKSSKIEGNTYSLLDTEKLIIQGIKASGHDIHEAIMILNHKEAFKFIRENTGEFKEITPAKIEEVHKILIKGLDVDAGFRQKAVGVTGSLYRPLDTVYQVKEAVSGLCNAVNKISSPYAKALVVLAGLSYIQAFEDGNKRTSRLIANALLLAYGHAPLSYRSVDITEYKEAILVFYELNSIRAFKKIFIDQYVFAAKNYSVTA